jgi:hypothetical protein
VEHTYIERWMQMLAHHDKPWVVFAHGTCVILREPGHDSAQQATELIERWPVHAGSELGDFSVLTLTDVPGWVITCAHPDILTYLAPRKWRGKGQLRWPWGCWDVRSAIRMHTRSGSSSSKVPSNTKLAWIAVARPRQRPLAPAMAWRKLQAST